MNVYHRGMFEVRGGALPVDGKARYLRRPLGGALRSALAPGMDGLNSELRVASWREPR
jgi:hypothetical protein